MALRRVLPLVLAFLCVPAHILHAQTAVYGTVNLTNWGFTNFQGNGYGDSFKNDSVSFTGGGFYNFRSSSRLKAGIDLRGVYGPGYNGGGAGLAAFRISFIPKEHRAQPFFEIGGGVVSSSYNEAVAVSYNQFTLQNHRSTNGDLMLDFGLDLRVAPQWDWRIFDYGAAATGATNGADFAWFGTGIVYHLPSR